MDVAGHVWTISAARMKAKRELGYCSAGRRFRSSKPRGRSAVAHGFRSSFRDWAAEETAHLREVIEAAFAHVVPSKVEAAYARANLFDRRRVLLDDWAAYLAGQPAPKGVRARS